MLFSLAILDALLLATGYNLLFWHRFDRWAGITGSIATVIAIWVCLSYLLGRYSKADQTYKKRKSALTTTSAVSAITLAIIVVIISWGLRINDPRTFRSFVAPVLGVTTILSYSAQATVQATQRKPKQWILLGNEEEIKTLSIETQDEPDRVRRHTQLIAAEQASFGTQAIDKMLEGIAVSETAEIDDATIETLLALRSNGLSIMTLVNWCEENLQRVPPELFSSRWLVQAEGFDLQPGRWNWRVKRMGDVAVAILLLLVTLPILGIAAILIRLEDGGPILYSQLRTGLYGKEYRVWKLRTMRVKAETGSAVWSAKGDPRITTVGYWLRRTRIDELPQLICVLKGEMSLIGPRPERPEIEDVLEGEIKHYRIRHWVRPGLSGWAQVCFPYGASVEDSRKKLSYDLYYLRNSSFLLDMLILIKTIRLVTRAEGALAKESNRPDLIE